MANIPNDRQGNNDPNNATTNGDTGLTNTDNAKQVNSATNNSTTSNETSARAGRRKPRRDGKGSNVKNNQHGNKKSATLPATATAVNTKDIQSGTTYENVAVTEDDAALAEGGLKAVGDKKIIPFMKIEKPMAIFSIIMVLASIAALIFNGLNLGLDFTGGVSADVSYAEPVAQVEVVQALSDHGFDDAIVQYLGSTRDLLVRLPPQADNVDGLDARLTAALRLPNNPENAANISSINIIGSQVGNEVYINSLIAIIMALVCMLLYVAVRFQFKLAIGALLALFHDAIVTLGIFAMFGFPFDLTVLAAILALIGYSLNDTIVVYDRIRENFRRVRDATPTQIIDLSLTETLRRTIMTVSTVFLVVIAMKLLGGAGLEWFSVALLIGLVAGTYSSTYISSSIPLAMGLSRDDFVVKIKPEFEEEEVVFNDPKAYEYEDEEDQQPVR